LAGIENTSTQILKIILGNQLHVHLKMHTAFSSRRHGVDFEEAKGYSGQKELAEHRFTLAPCTLNPVPWAVLHGSGAFRFLRDSNIGMNFMTRFMPRPRKEYLLQQKEKHGRHLFGVFPAQYPREILWALNALPVEIWDPPLEVSHANAHLQPYICSVVKLGLELILQGHGNMLDGFLFPHTCDSIQNLASIVNDYLGLSKPCYFFYHPKAPYRPSSRLFYLQQLKDLVSSLESQLGPMDPKELRRRVQQGQKIAASLGEVYRLRREGKLLASNHEFYQVIRQGEYLHPDDFLPLLHEFLESSRGESRARSRLILSGVLPNPIEILTLLDELGVMVADDDFLSCSRRLLLMPSHAEDPFEALTESYFAMAPCTTKDTSVEERIGYLSAKIQKSGAKGVIFWIVKFCEPELFDVPQVVESIKREGVATLILDTDLNQGLSGQMTTRVEAFVEMIG
jgi:benzoyl-CoA reductase/2-hydroxyglutaryl-CoA dehydratase subunit BcrC/BadD/HgdB